MTSLSEQDEALGTLLGISSVTLRGKDLIADVAGRCTTSSVSRSIGAASTFSLTFSDSKRVLARSGIFGDSVTCHVGSYPYSIVSIGKVGENLTVTFEDEVVTRLQSITTPFVVKPGIMTHVDFVRTLLKPLRWLKFMTVDDPAKYGVVRSLTVLNRGSASGKHKANPEGTWAAINRIGTVRGWRTFVRGTDELWYVPDTFLFDAPVAYTLSEDTTWVNDIDYDINIRKRVAGTLKVTVQAAEWAIPPGVVVNVTDPGPSNGKWLVQDITRSPLSNPQATITLVHPKKPLPEPVPNAVSSTGSSGSSGSAGVSISSNMAIAVAQYAIEAGFTGDKLLTAVEVSFAEDSTHDPGTLSPPNSDGSIDRGLWQINSKTHANYSDADMADGLKNAQAAYQISTRGDNWFPWTTYISGASNRYKAQAQSAIASAQKLAQQSGGTATIGTGSGGVAPNAVNTKLAADFVNEVLSQAGKPYIFGDESAPSNSNPNGFDCSSLIAWGAGRVGVNGFPRNAEAQYEACVNAGTSISAARAINIRGAILFKAGSDPQGTYGIGHVAISMGNGKDTFEAYDSGYALNIFHDATQFTRGGLVPGMKY